MLLCAETLGPVLLVGPPPIDDDPTNARLRVLNTRLMMLGIRLHIPYLPTLAPLLDDPLWIAEARAGDGAHPGALGYAAMARLIAA